MKNIPNNELITINGGFGYHGDQSWYDGASYSWKYSRDFLGGLWDHFAGVDRYRPCDCE